MPPKATRGSTNKMLGGTRDDLNPRGLIKDIIEQVGGRQAFAKNIAKYLNDEKANPYLQSRSMQNIMRLLTVTTDVDTEDADVLTDEELEVAVMKDAICFFVVMPDDVFTLLFDRIMERRKALAAARSTADASLKQQLRPIG